MPKDKLTKLLDIKYPIIQGGMAGISESMLVSAVSNALRLRNGWPKKLKRPRRLPINRSG